MGLLQDGRQGGQLVAVAGLGGGLKLGQNFGERLHGIVAAIGYFVHLPAIIWLDEQVHVVTAALAKKPSWRANGSLAAMT